MEQKKISSVMMLQPVLDVLDIMRRDVSKLLAFSFLFFFFCFHPLLLLLLFCFLLVQNVDEVAVIGDFGILVGSITAKQLHLLALHHRFYDLATGTTRHFLETMRSLPEGTSRKEKKGKDMKGTRLVSWGLLAGKDQAGRAIASGLG